MRGLLRRSPTERTRSDSLAWAPSKPSVKDVDGSVMVSVEHNPTVDTHMCTSTEVFVLAFLSTCATHLAGFLWINLQAGNTGPFCLVFHQFNEACPSSV